MARWIVRDPRGNVVRDTTDPEVKRRFERGGRYTVQRADTPDEEQDEEGGADTEDAPPDPSPSAEDEAEEEAAWDPDEYEHSDLYQACQSAGLSVDWPGTTEDYVRALRDAGEHPDDHLD